MAITVPQIPAAIQTATDLVSQLRNMTALLNQAKGLSDKGWTVDIGTTAPILISVPVASRNDLVAQYDGIKTQLVTIFQQLP